MIKELSIIFVITYIGDVISKLINFSFPGPIIGMLILFILLERNILKIKMIEKGSSLILSNIAIFFIPPGVGLISALGLLDGNILKILITMILTTIITMATTGFVVQFLILKEEK